MIILKNVCKSFQGKTILDNVSFNLNRGEIIGLLGPSGCGKSTILNLVSGCCSIDSGELTVRTNRVGFVFQDHRLLPWLTAFENIIFALNALPESLDKKEQVIRAEAVLKSVGLADYSDYYPSQLSGGMCQRVSIARAFSIYPEILLLDEPFSALDMKLKEKILLDLQRLIINHPKMTVIYVTHNPDELDKIAHSIYFLDKNKLTSRSI